MDRNTQQGGIEEKHVYSLISVIEKFSFLSFS